MREDVPRGDLPHEDVYQLGLTLGCHLAGRNDVLARVQGQGHHILLVQVEKTLHVLRLVHDYTQGCR